MARKFEYNGKVYNSMASIAKELGIDRLYPRNFAKYGVKEITEDNVQVGETQGASSIATGTDGAAPFHDPTTRHELVGAHGQRFNKRAFVTHIKNQNFDLKYLVSYGGVVAKIEHGMATVYGTYSSETLTHIKEFLQQNGFPADTCAQIREYYMY